MDNKKSLLQDSLKELENIKNESLELAKEQLINESADLLEKKSAELFQKLISEEIGEEKVEEEKVKEKAEEKAEEKSEKEDIKEDLTAEKILEELDSDEEELDSDEEDMDSDEDEMSLSDLRKAAEELGFKLVKDAEDSDDEGGEDLEEPSDDEDMDDSDDDIESDDEDMDDSDDIEFDDEESDDEEFSDVEVDNKVLAEAEESKMDIDKVVSSIKQIGTRNYAIALMNHYLKRIRENTRTIADSPDLMSTLDEIDGLLREIIRPENIQSGKSAEMNKEAHQYAIQFVMDYMQNKYSVDDLDENFKRNNTKMRNTKKEVLKDLRDVSFNKLVEAYYNMDDNDSFIIKEDKYMEEDLYDEGMHTMDINPTDEGYDEYEEGYHSMMDEDLFEDESYEEGWNMHEEETPIHDKAREISYRPKSMGSEKPPVRTGPDGSRYSYEKRGKETIINPNPSEEMVYEFDMPEEYSYEEGFDLSEDEINEMLDEMDVSSEASNVSGLKRLQGRNDFPADRGMRSSAEETEARFSKQGLPSGIVGENSSLEEAFEEMTLEELMQMEAMLEDDSAAYEEGATIGKHDKMMFDAENVDEDFLEEEIEEDIEEDIEEGMAYARQGSMSVGGEGVASREGRPERRSNMNEDVQILKEKIAKLQEEKAKLEEGFGNKVKSLENKVYDVTISALKAGFVNKFLLEHPLRENEKSEIVYRFANAQTKEQIKETYISLTNEFAKGQTVKDGSMLNESVQNKVGKVHRTDNAIVREKNLINENDETNRFKQLLNYNFGKKK